MHLRLARWLARHAPVVIHWLQLLLGLVNYITILSEAEMNQFCNIANTYRVS
jgi:hypothetical protein